MPSVTVILLPLTGALWTFCTWCAAVAPLWAAHESNERRAAVGRVIGALLQLQLGFMLIAPERMFICLAVLLWFSARMIRRFQPTITGS